LPIRADRGDGQASLAEIKEGSFIGVSAMPQPDGTQKAYAIHIFMERRRAWWPIVLRLDSKPGSTMTNANVATTVAGKDGQDLLVKYKDGERSVGAAGIIARYAPGTADDSRCAKIFVAGAAKQPTAPARAQRRGRPRHRPAAIGGRRA